MTVQNCQACGSDRLDAFYEASGVPNQSCILLDSRHEAEQFPMGDIVLVLCDACGFIQNSHFDPSLVDYAQPTEESQAFSGEFSRFAEALADELVERYDLVGRTAFEVGCGKGDFLAALAGRGLESVVGIDPGYLKSRIDPPANAVFLRDWFGPDNTHLTGDLVLSRHLMEHVSNVAEFFGYLRESVQRSSTGALFTEVPDATRVLVEGAFWDIYYEHCSYWTIDSLRTGLEIAGFTVDWIRLDYADQYLVAGSSLGSPTVVRRNPEAVREDVESFASLAAEKVVHWEQRIAAAHAAARTVAVWGGGSKAVAFLSTLGIKDVSVVDINPHKQGKWLPGASVQVQDPQSLIDIDPSLVIAMNPIYLDEIRSDLTVMGLTPVLVAVQ